MAVEPACAGAAGQWMVQAPLQAAGGYRHGGGELLRNGQGGVVLLCKESGAFLLLTYHGIELVHQLSRHGIQRESLGFGTHMML